MVYAPSNVGTGGQFAASRLGMGTARGIDAGTGTRFGSGGCNIDAGPDIDSDPDSAPCRPGG